MTCDHVCCADRLDAFHDHFLNAAQCPRCESIRVEVVGGGGVSKLSDAATEEARKVVRGREGISLLRATAEWLRNCADPDLRATEHTVEYLRVWADALEGGARLVQEGHAVVDGKVWRTTTTQPPGSIAVWLIPTEDSDD